MTPSHFFRASAASLRSDQRPLLCGTVNNLLSRVAGGCCPPSALQQLYALKALVQRRQPHDLEKALVELLGTSPLPSGQRSRNIPEFQSSGGGVTERRLGAFLAPLRARVPLPSPSVRPCRRAFAGLCPRCIRARTLPLFSLVFRPCT